MKARLAAAASLLALTALPASGSAVYRCASSTGVTYQEVPCQGSSAGERANIPTDFPEPNHAARERLLAREAELYKRLEARRDRDLREAILREAAAERQLERDRLAALLAAQQSQPQFVLAYPARMPRSRGARSYPNPASGIR